MPTKAYSYVRFSTISQAQGSSLQRQTDAANDWIKAKGPEFVLDTKLKMKDLGVSAFHGQNAAEGALADFVAAIKTGQVPQGSYLLIENLDRLSREQVTTALELFLGIIRRGIRIVTLIDQHEYSQESLRDNPYQLLLSIVSMIRANEESVVKSDRVSKAWKKKRDDALAGKPLTRQCPAWLQVEGGPKDYVRKYSLIEERVKILLWIFEKMASGWGQGRVAEDLNRRGVAPWGGSKNKTGRWHDSYITLLARNRAVLGETQLFKGDGKSRRIPVGDPIPDYFPPVISPELFAKVNAARTARRINNFVGRQGTNISNLFQGLVHDIATGQRCVYISHSRIHPWQYLTPPVKAVGQRGWNYRQFEQVFLEH